MDARPGGCVFGECAVVVAAGVVDIPAKVWRVESVLFLPIGHGRAIECRRLGAAGHGNGELAGSALFGNDSVEKQVLVAVARSASEFRLNAFLPAAVQEEALLWIEAQNPVVPAAIAEHAQFFHQLASERFAFGGHRKVVGGPGKARDFVLSPAGIAAGLLLHFQDDEIVEAFLVEAPGGAEAGDSGADDDGRNMDFLLRRLEWGSIAQAMAHREGVVNERAGDLGIGFASEADEGGGGDQEVSPVHGATSPLNRTFVDEPAILGSVLLVRPMRAGAAIKKCRRFRARPPR